MTAICASATRVALSWMIASNSRALSSKWL